MTETEFCRAAADTLRLLAERLEPLDNQGLIDVDSHDDVLTVELNDGRQFVVNRHAPTQEIWLSSPFSGGLHFSSGTSGQWILKDGRTLAGIFSDDIFKATGARVVF